MKRSIPEFVLVGFLFWTLAGMSVFARSPAVPPAPGTVYLIICPAALVNAFEPLALHRAATGLPSGLVTLEEALAVGPVGRDDAETLRNYLMQLRAGGTLRYVLLGGDSERMPVRVVRSTFYPPGGFTDLSADVYFAGLDGDWDADGDGVFGEPFLSAAAPGDNADLDPDLAVGRAPVSTPQQAARFTQAILEYEGPLHSGHLGAAALLAEVLFPVNWSGGPIQLDGAFYAEAIRSRFAGLTPPVASTRLYENASAYPGAQPLTRASALDALGAGLQGTIYYLGGGDALTLSTGTGSIGLADLDALTNAPYYSFFVALSSSAGRFAGECVLEHLLEAPSGGSAGTLGFSDAAFPSTASDYVAGFFASALAVPGVPVGDALRDALHTHAPSTQINTAARWTSLTMILLGDPAMPLRTEPGPVATPRTGVGALKARFR